MDHDEITVTFKINRRALNQYLGNTSKPTSKQAMQEVLNSLIKDGLASGCGCGCNCFEPDPLPISFNLVE